MFLLCLVSAGAHSQRLLEQDSSSVRLSMGAFMGRDFCGYRYLSNDVGVEYSSWITPKVNFRIGADVGFIHTNAFSQTEDKAPYSDRYRKTAAYAGADIAVNPRMIVSVTAFFDNISLGGLNNRFHTSNLGTVGFNARMRYKLKDDSFIDLSLTFIESNNPFSYHNPYSLYYNPYGVGPFSGRFPSTFMEDLPFTSFWLP